MYQIYSKKKKKRKISEAGRGSTVGILAFSIFIKPVKSHNLISVRFSAY